MKIKYSMIIGCTSWCGLGFYRGVNYYKYNLDKYKINYLDSIIYGFYEVLMYINPAFLPITIYKEFYRLEVNVRNLQDKKKSKYYNNILF